MSLSLPFPGCRTGLAHRGEETRKRILDAAVEIFAAVGYEAAYTRLLAERAGVKLPAISYYFASKEGLFRAVIEQIAAKLERSMAPAADRARAGLAEPDASRERLVGLLCDLLDSFVATMLGPEFDDSCRLIVARAEVENIKALEPLRDCVVRHMVEPSKSLIARLRGAAPDDMRDWMRAAALLGQINIFTKPQVRHGLGWPDYGAERVRMVQGIVRENVMAMYGSLRGAG